MESVYACLLVKGFEKIARTVDQRTMFYLRNIQFFLDDITWLCLIVIGENASKVEMVLLVTGHDSSFSQSNVCSHHQTTKLSVFGPQNESSERESRFCLLYSRDNWNYCWLIGKHTFWLDMLDNTHLQ